MVVIFFCDYRVFDVVASPYSVCRFTSIAWNIGFRFHCYHAAYDGCLHMYTCLFHHKHIVVAQAMGSYRWVNVLMATKLDLEYRA